MNKPEPNMLKILPNIPSSTSQKFYPLFLFYSHIITYYSHTILYVLLFMVLTIRETWTLCILIFVVTIVYKYISDVYTYK